MMIILFLALSLIPASSAQQLHLQEARSCGLTLVHENLPNDWFEPDEAAPQVEASARIFKRVGRRTNHLEMPWIVQVVNDLDEGVCTGSLISRWWVITAAHCMTYIDEMHLHEWIGPTQIEIKAGPWNLTATGFLWRRRSQNWFVPNEFRQKVHINNYNKTAIGRPYDIALVLMAEPLNPIHEPMGVRFLVNYICLPNRQPDFTQIYRVAGFGNMILPSRTLDFSFLRDYRSGIRNGTACRFGNYNYTFHWLQRIRPLIHYQHDNYEMPQLMYQEVNWTGDPKMVCTSAFEQIGVLEQTTCLGDSGGPLSVLRSYPDNQGHYRWELTGVVEGNMQADQKFFIDFLTHYQRYGGLPGITRQGIVERANRIITRYDMRWPCGHESYFNLVMGYEDWLVHIIATESPGDPTISWLYVASLTGLGFGAVLHGTVKRLLQPPALEADPGQAPEPGQAPVPGQDVEVGQPKH